MRNTLYVLLGLLAVSFGVAPGVPGAEGAEAAYVVTYS
jgi:hypothetical protein